MFENLFNDDKKTLKKLNKFADKVENYAAVMEAKTDDELKAYTDKFKADLAAGKTLDDIEAEAFAVVREVARRTRGEYPYREQIMGGHVLHTGDVAELATGQGKSVDILTPIPTPSGWKFAQNIQIGDVVFDRKGKPTTITGVYPQGMKPVYELELQDGRFVRCNDEHLWSVYVGEDTELTTMTTGQVIQAMQNSPVFLPMNEAVELPEADLPMDPYLLGYLLVVGRLYTSDGSLYFETVDSEVVETIAKTMHPSYEHHSDDVIAFWHFIFDPENNEYLRPSDFTSDKEILDMLSAERVDERYIPAAFKAASIEQRKALIQGVMDACAFVDLMRSEVVLKFTSAQLGVDIMEVLFSLGISCRGIEEDAFDCNFFVAANIPFAELSSFFRAEAKKTVMSALQNMKDERDYSKIAIKDIRDTKEEVEQVCFTVDNDEHLFLVGEYVVTHNTLTASMPVYLNALEGKGVHVVTVNEYLSQRDADAMGQIYKFLGLTVGFNGRDMSQAEKRKAYACDITYSTNSELGFDYLRDNMVSEAKDRVQRGLHYVLVDEADSILIDEARTPLIISGKSTEEPDKYMSVDRAVKSLKEEDYEIFTKENQVALTLSGIERLQKWFHVKNLYDPQNQKILHKINKSLYANYILKKDIDYIVDGDNIELVDKFTGRVLKGHAYSEGLQQAIQAKEGVEIKPENKTVATITYQNFFRMYDKLSGMTGTAKTEEEEFLSIYNMFVIPIPTHQPVIREDKLDAIYRNKEVKYKAVVAEVKKAYLSGRPVLIGTADIETNELLSKMLDEAEVPHETLNAKNHAKEAEIIARAGFPHAVTLATDMAGRGTDIKLPKASRDLGGLYVIGTERHEARRIDNQLRGRSGRQGDPGASIFFVSLEDDLMKRFGGPKIQKMFEKTMSDDKLESRSLSKAITNAQKEIEGNNFDSRKQIIEFDDVLREQREVYYERRDAMVDAGVDDLPALFKTMFDAAVQMVSDEYPNDPETLYHEFHDVFQIVNLDDRTYQYAGEIVTVDELKKAKNPAARTKLLQDRLWDYFIQLISINENCYRQCLRIGKKVALQIMDEEWIDHIDYMDKLRNAISLRSYAQRKPVEEYKEEGYKAFSNFISLMSLRVAETIASVRPRVIATSFGQPQPSDHA